MKIELRLLASMRRHLPEKYRQKGSCFFEIREGASCRDLLEQAGIWGKSTLVVLVNGRYAPAEKELSQGDVVAVFPPVAGG